MCSARGPQFEGTPQENSFCGKLNRLTSILCDAAAVLALHEIGAATHAYASGTLAPLLATTNIVSCKYFGESHHSAALRIIGIIKPMQLRLTAPNVATAAGAPPARTPTPTPTPATTSSDYYHHHHHHHQHQHHDHDHCRSTSQNTPKSEARVCKIDKCILR